MSSFQDCLMEPPTATSMIHQHHQSSSSSSPPSSSISASISTEDSQQSVNSIYELPLSIGEPPQQTQISIDESAENRSTAVLISNESNEAVNESVPINSSNEEKLSMVDGKFHQKQQNDYVTNRKSNDTLDQTTSTVATNESQPNDDNIIQEGKIFSGKFREKCAEIFIENGIYSINCEFCTKIFQNLVEFSCHMLENHLKMPPIMSEEEELETKLSFNDQAELKEILRRKLPQTLNLLKLKKIPEFNENNNVKLIEKSRIGTLLLPPPSSLLTESSLQTSSPQSSSLITPSSLITSSAPSTLQKQPIVKKFIEVRKFSEMQKIPDTTDKNESILIDSGDDDDGNIENISCEVDAGLFFNYDDNSIDFKYNYNNMSYQNIQQQEQQKQQNNQQTQVQSRRSFAGDYNYLQSANTPNLSSQNSSFFNNNDIQGDNGNSSIMKNQWFREQDGRYHCQYCDKNYQYSKSLKEHIESQHKPVEKDFVCSICSKAFSKQWKLNTHLKVHTDERPFICTVCVMTFKWKKNLQRHLMRIHNIKLSELPRESYCNNTSKLKELLEKPSGNNSLVDHIKNNIATNSMSAQKIEYQNTISSQKQILKQNSSNSLRILGDQSFSSSPQKRFQNSANTQQNRAQTTMRQQIKIDKFQDSINNLELSNVQDPSENQNNSISLNDDNDGDIEEAELEEGLAADFAIVNHCIDDDDEDDDGVDDSNNYRNEIYFGGNQKSFSEKLHSNELLAASSMKLESHEENLSFNETNFMSQQQNYSKRQKLIDSNYYSYQQHSFGSYGNTCGSEYIPLDQSEPINSTEEQNLDSIRNHFVSFAPIVNEQEKNKSLPVSTIQPNKDGLYACRVCKKLYLRKDSLRAHMRIHTAGLECSYCGKMFTHKYFLERHIRTHTGERPFSCHLCSLAFADENTLKNHIKTHTGEKKFECQFCQKKFIKQYEKIDHERNVHNNQNPYECKDCKENFNQFRLLRFHRRFCPSRK